ncbi:hypothetical protein BO94DRAFT_254870, partial [Aspergillus sclerotioniger CBS 115572]
LPFCATLSLLLFLPPHHPSIHLVSLPTGNWDLLTIPTTTVTTSPHLHHSTAYPTHTRNIKPNYPNQTQTMTTNPKLTLPATCPALHQGDSNN